MTNINMRMTVSCMVGIKMKRRKKTKEEEKEYHIFFRELIGDLI